MKIAPWAIFVSGQQAIARRPLSVVSSPLQNLITRRK
jgi:hypothetical protein